MRHRILGILALLSSAVAAPAAAQTVYGLVGSDRIVTFGALSPSTVLTDQQITGLPRGEVLTGIDFRPADQNIYSVSASGSLYRLAQAGAGYTATLIGATAQPIGTNYGIDFNPTVDRLRLVSDIDQNLRINPADGATITDGTIRDANGTAAYNLLAVGYTNSFAGATSTVLYGIDALSQSLVRSTNANGGVYVNTNVAGAAFGPLGVDLGDQPIVGFDILSTAGANQAYLSANDLLYSVDLVTGAATSLGEIGADNIRGITLMAAAVPEPATWGMMVVGFGLMGTALRRRSRTAVTATA